jgi:hypothetical protein
VWYLLVVCSGRVSVQLGGSQCLAPESVLGQGLRASGVGARQRTHHLLIQPNATHHRHGSDTYDIPLPLDMLGLG